VWPVYQYWLEVDLKFDVWRFAWVAVCRDMAEYLLTKRHRRIRILLPGSRGIMSNQTLCRVYAVSSGGRHHQGTSQPECMKGIDKR